MKLIVGLGNPDLKYQNTFHNLGFMAVDGIAKLAGVTFDKTCFRAVIAEYRVGGEKVLLAKPQTYMNLSGESVREIINFYKIDNKDLLVIYDDFDIYKGEVRIREKGSAGTHNGMRNIVKEISSEDFMRIRIGFKPIGENKIPLIDYVLSGIKEEDKPLFDLAIERASNAGYEFSQNKPVQEIMQKYNGIVTL